MGLTEWHNPITANAGEVQRGIDPLLLRPSRVGLKRSRLETQRTLVASGRARYTIIQVDRDGVIVDGHHAVRVAAEMGLLIDVLVSPLPAAPEPGSILDLPVT